MDIIYDITYNFPMNDIVTACSKQLQTVPEITSHWSLYLITGIPESIGVQLVDQKNDNEIF